jgi:hypothetical protein
LCQILSPWSGGVPEVSTHPKSKNKCGSAKYKQVFDLPTCAKYRAFFVVEFVLLVCWKERGIRRKRLGICWEFFVILGFWL